MFLVIIAFLAASVEAKNVSLPAPHAVEELDLTQIEADMRAAGHPVVHTICGGAPPKCTVTLQASSRAKASDLAPHFVAAKTLSRKRAEEEAAEKVLIDKLEAGTATQAEKDQLLLRLLKKNGRR